VLVAASAHGITIALLIASMGHISGGHFNPAVTLGVLLSGNIAIVNAIAYMLVQLLGGFCGSLLARCAVRTHTRTTVQGRVHGHAVGGGRWRFHDPAHGVGLVPWRPPGGDSHLLARQLGALLGGRHGHQLAGAVRHRPHRLCGHPRRVRLHDGGRSSGSSAGAPSRARR